MNSLAYINSDNVNNKEAEHNKLVATKREHSLVRDSKENEDRKIPNDVCTQSYVRGYN